MSPVFDCTEPTDEQRDEAFDAAQEALAEGRVVVLPTDTVYGVAADPFHAEGVPNVLAAKQRGADKPPPVMVPSIRTVDGLATSLQPYVRRLLSECWPGPLTVVVQAQPSLQWDLGATNGTVALRMPDHDLALRLLSRTGPLAVTSANVTGQPAATTVLEAATQLGSAVQVYLDGGPTPGNRPSTILDCTRPSPVILRMGALSVERLEEVLGEEVHLRLSPAEPEPAADREALEKELRAAGRSTEAAAAASDGAVPHDLTEAPVEDPADVPLIDDEDEEAGRREEAEQEAWLARLEEQETQAVPVHHPLTAGPEESPVAAAGAPTGPAPRGATSLRMSQAHELPPEPPSEEVVEDDGVAQAHEPTASTLRTVAVPVDREFDVVEVDAEGHEVHDAPTRRLRSGRAHEAGPSADAPSATPVNDDRSTR
ncbi:L-threonylcarbamoyladenylate synthase [Kytococcus sp. HMSC28H12]|uniref:L-threonylcarbamoyladenylate synthase n=1 Tax=Kytococcus sp. HMSC28H12 TaxID=1581067 RepID=UPI0008A36F15|nr:L-threonylcarbamoyladenylate synthase [Kytococcus sp. HMSC28H12]